MPETELKLGEEAEGRPKLISESMREALDELEQYLEDVPVERAETMALPFAARWILFETSFDVVRLREEADTFAKAQPLSDRILTAFPDRLAWWVGQRMLLDADDQEQPQLAAESLDAARTLLGRRADAVEGAGFPRIAAAVRHALSGDLAPRIEDDRVWKALAKQIAESVLP